MEEQDLFSSLIVAHVSTASFITQVFFDPFSVSGEQSFIILWLMIYTPLNVPHVDGKPANLFGGQHLKSLSGVVLSAVFLISPMSETRPGNQGKSKFSQQSVP